MSVFSCSHPDQGIHKGGASGYHSVFQDGRYKIEKQYRSEWYLKWGWFPATRYIYIKTVRRDCT